MFKALVGEEAVEQAAAMLNSEKAQNAIKKAKQARDAVVNAGVKIKKQCSFSAGDVQYLTSGYRVSSKANSSIHQKRNTQRTEHTPTFFKIKTYASLTRS